MDRKEIIALAKEEFTDFAGWLRNWTEHIVYMKRTSENERFFLGNSSYMDLGELLRQNENEKSSPCVIYDTDIHGTAYETSLTYERVHSLYLCVIADTNDGESIKRAKYYAETLALKLLKWIEVCKRAKNRNVTHVSVSRTRIDSTTPFLNGWQAVTLKVVEVVKQECFNEGDYV